MTLKEALLDHMQKYIAGGNTWGGSWFTSLPTRDPVMYQLRVDLTTALKVETEKLDDTVESEFAAAFSVLFAKFELDVLEKNCSSASLDTMRERISQTMAPYNKPVSPIHPARDVQDVDLAADDLSVTAEASPATDWEEDEQALVAVHPSEPEVPASTLWRYRDYCAGMEAMPEMHSAIVTLWQEEAKQSSLVTLWQEEAKQSSLFVRNQMLSEQGVKSFERMDYFQRLGVEHSATSADIHHAYLRLALQFHPDKLAREPEKQQGASQITQLLIEAHDVLMDDKRRAGYLAKIMCDETRLALSNESVPTCFQLLGIWPQLPCRLIGPAGLMIMAARNQAALLWGVVKDEVCQGFDELGRLVDEIDAEFAEEPVQSRPSP